MDISDFNVFADKHSDGRRDDASSMHPSAGSAQGNAAANNINFDALQQLLSMQMQFPMSVDNSSSNINTGQPSSASNTNTAALLEQQIRLQQLQQLQQLQNQIFQQQIELISGQSSLSASMESTPLQQTPFRDVSQFQGLPTPVNSTELRPQPPPNFVSPMILQNYLAQPGPAAHLNTPHSLPQGSSSAPAHLAFPTQAPPVSPDLDFSISSPWLGAVSYQPVQQQLQQQSQERVQAEPKRRGSKRGASSSGDDSIDGARKRQSPAVRAVAGSRRKTMNARGSVSASATPAIRAQSGGSSIVLGDFVGDTPSPVDLSMPPPTQPPESGGSTSSSAQPSSAFPSGSSQTSPALSPVTPASIMNLGRLGLGSGLSSPAPEGHTQTQTQSVEKGKGKAKTKSPPNPKPSNTSTTTKSVSKRRSSTSLISPSLKPLLPGGLAPSSAAQLGSQSNYSHHISGSAAALHIAPATPLPQPTPAIRKTSHKAAEQKRRDSLKTSFDALRFLLPPLPLPSDENYAGEVPLPGSMPPRGPPRGDVSGPNRAVSKLQLLRAGNDFIRVLKGRVERRDEYIGALKEEVRALRARVEVLSSSLSAKEGEAENEKGVDVDGLLEEIEKVDLDRDLDAEEDSVRALGVAEGSEVDEEFE
ncbi:uncharacterized protein FOMMEDRAFT_142904 [Fomitiporia mediterranea MF3/22]|uniref:uncharacterized protein n=1 Tax=Fomitiporia mediterranea (strain MF3/22) TaxID=694068 RepID=UPI0004409CD0|nr:uncharacterized protein FOMMEDRAFT_142904 [Fomitiporia mediterranea MF3/22]EJC99373.1 hypothetical protein FOMMEDRAFT_142904 [Fomitiporia mediterranea MF3/22]